MSFRRSRQIQRFILPFAAVAAVVLFYRVFLLPGRFAGLNDLIFFHLPLRATLAELAHQGLPQWNPFIHGGQPVLSNPNYGAFYPPAWLALVLPVVSAVKILVVAHALFAFAGAWKLARALGCSRAPAALAGLGFLAGGATLSAVNLLTIFFALTWLPWILLWTDRALERSPGASRLPIGLAACGIAAQFVAGEPVTAAVGAVAAIVWTAFCPAPAAATAVGERWRSLRQGLLIVLLAVGIAAVQLVPMLVHLGSTSRAAAAPENLLIWSTPIERLIEFVLPHWHGDPMLAPDGLYAGGELYERGFPYLMALYPGLIVAIFGWSAMFLLAGWRSGLPSGSPTRWSRERRALGAFGLMMGLGVFLALGRYNPVYSGFLVHLPPFSVLRFPEKFLLLTTTALPFVAALGWNRALAGDDRLGRRWAMTGTIAALLVGIVAFLRAVRLAGSAGPPSDPSAALTAFLGRETLILGAVAVLAAVVVGLHRRLPRRVSQALVLVLLVGDLALAHRRLLPATEAGLLRPGAPVESLAGQRIFSDSGARVGRPYVAFRSHPGEKAPWIRQQIDLLEPYVGALWGLHYVLHPDFDFMLTEPARQALALWQEVAAGAGSAGSDDAALARQTARILGAWNVGTLVTLRPVEEQRAELAATSRRPNPARLLDNPAVLPRFRFVSAAGFHRRLDDAVGAAASAGFAMAEREELIDWKPGFLAPGGGSRSFDSTARVTAVEPAADGFRLRYRAAGPALLVTATTFDRAWRATVAGAPALVYRTALGQTAITVPAATDGEVRLRYQTPGLALGACVTLLTLLLGLLGTVRIRRVAETGSGRPPSG